MYLDLGYLIGAVLLMTDTQECVNDYWIKWDRVIAQYQHVPV